MPILVDHLLAPAVPHLHAAHPHLQLELIADSRNANLPRREAGVALRPARPREEPSGCDAAAVVLYAVHGPRDGSAVLPWISYDEGQAHLPQAHRIDQIRGDDDVAAGALNDAEGIIRPYEPGWASRYCPALSATAIRHLCRLPGTVGVVREPWLLTNGPSRHPARIAAVTDWVTRVVKAWLSPTAAAP